MLWISLGDAIFQSERDSRWALIINLKEISICVNGV